MASNRLIWREFPSRLLIATSIRAGDPRPVSHWLLCALRPCAQGFKACLPPQCVVNCVPMHVALVASQRIGDLRPKNSITSCVLDTTAQRALTYRDATHSACSFVEVPVEMLGVGTHDASSAT